jgi:hypothetical protein
MRHIKQKFFEFRFIGNCPNFNELKKCILSLSEDNWKEFTYRQNNIVGHKDTLTIPLLFDQKQSSREIKHPKYEMFAGHLKTISDYLSSLGEPSKIKRANLVLLKAKSLISTHIDKGEFLQSTHRIHIPIITNENCYFVIEGKQEQFKESELWEINNTGKYHSVHNEGDSDRIHLIIDIG